MCRAAAWGLCPAGRHDPGEGLVEPLLVVAEQVEELVVDLSRGELVGQGARGRQQDGPGHDRKEGAHGPRSPLEIRP
jgi:hypothetical protein